MLLQILYPRARKVADIRLRDVITISLPSASPQITINTINLNFGDKILFTNLSDSSLNNKVYKVVRKNRFSTDMKLVPFSDFIIEGFLRETDYVEVISDKSAFIFIKGVWIPFAPDLDSDDSTAIEILKMEGFAIEGDSVPSGNLILEPTSDAVKGDIIMNTSGGNTVHNNFTKLGNDAPSIKMKKVTGTTGATEGSAVNIVHGLTLSKIIGFDILVTATNGNIIPMSFVSVAEFQFDAFLQPTNIRVVLSTANSGSILSSAFTVLLTYEE